MGLSLIIALLAYLLSPRDTAKERRQALLNAGIAGGVTYGVTEYTDWGQENLAPLDDSIASVFTPTPDLAIAGEGTTTATIPTSTWDTLKSYGAPALAAVAGATVAGGGLTSLLPWILGAIGVYLVLKD